MNTKNIFLWIFILTLISCNDSNKISFESQWEKMNDRIWTGPAFWANPMQDWRIEDGRLECINQGANRNVHLLTYQLKPESSVKMSVVVDWPDENFTGWVGFRFASRGNLDEYRHNAINSTVSHDAMLRSDGTLVLKDDSINITWDDKIELVLELKPFGTNHQVQFIVKNSEGRNLGMVEAEYPSTGIHGNLALVCHSNKNKQGSYGEPVVAFEDLKIIGKNLRGSEAQMWGPILWAQYTVDRGILKLSAQFPPIGPEDSKQVSLELDRGNGWEKAAESMIDDLARVALFRVEKWDENLNVPYRVVYDLDGSTHYYKGEIRRNPVDKEEMVVAAFTGNKDYGFPNTPIVENLNIIDPDLLFFSGDHIYESVAGYGIVRSPVDKATLDYLRKWYLLGWSFGDLLKNRPSVIIPDDHDVYQGNIWGQDGRSIPKGESFSYGGFVMDPAWVNMVQRTQTAHLPDPFDPAPVKQGITVYYTDLSWGNVSFAILEDRKFKTGPNSEEAKDPDQLELLGDRQHEFLDHWVEDWEGVSMKATLSQTVFAQCHTHGGSASRPQWKSDRDANGWPPEQRNEALRIIRKAHAFMLAGDNHLPTVVHHGIDTWEDAGVSFTVPSIAAGFPRAWWPDKTGLEKYPGLPEYFTTQRKKSELPDYTGRFYSPREHPITMLAAANPEMFLGDRETKTGDFKLLNDKRSGFGVVRFNTPKREITIECYPILATINDSVKEQYDGWPVHIDHKMNYYRDIIGYLKEISIEGANDPVLKVYKEETDELVYTIRLRKNNVRPWVFEQGTYRVQLGYPETGKWVTYDGMEIKR